MDIHFGHGSVGCNGVTSPWTNPANFDAPEALVWRVQDQVLENVAKPVLPAGGNFAHHAITDIYFAAR